MVFQFHVNKQIITAECPGRLVVADSRDVVKAQFVLDGEWDGLAVTALFANDFVSSPPVEVLLTSAEPVAVPPEMLAAGQLRVSLVGLGDGGQLRLTTKFMDKPIRVYRSGPYTGISTEDVTPDLWEQVLAAMGDLGSLETEDKSSLVAAINEAAKTGSGGGGGTAEGAVLYNAPQTLTDEQKAQARENIGARPGIVTVEVEQTGYTSFSISHELQELVAAHEAGYDLRLFFDLIYYEFESWNPLVTDSTTNLKGVMRFRYEQLDTMFVSTVELWGLTGTRVKTETSRAFAHSDFPGGVIADPAEETDTVPARIGEDGKLYVTPSGGSGEVPDNLPNPNKLIFSGAVTAEYDGSEEVTVEIPKTGVTGEFIPVPATATVGQTIQVTAVDAEGKPTAWEAVDLPSGGENYEFIKSVTVDAADVARIDVSLDADYNGILVTTINGGNAATASAIIATAGQVKVHPFNGDNLVTAASLNSAHAVTAARQYTYSIYECGDFYKFTAAQTIISGGLNVSGAICFMKKNVDIADASKINRVVLDLVGDAVFTEGLTLYFYGVRA